jgi:SPP1 gp7 family putative phage head morphogenesis protein
VPKVPVANEVVFDRGVRHALRLGRFTTRETNQLLHFLNGEVLPKAQRTLRDRLARAKALGGDPGEWTTERVRKIVAGVNGVIGGGLRQAGKALREDLAEMAVDEAAWQKAVIGGAIPDAIDVDLELPSVSQLNKIISSQPFKGKTLSKWWGKINGASRSAVDSAIKLGIASGETTAQIVRRLSGTEGGKFMDGVFGGLRRNVASTTQTAITHISSKAREATYKANDDVVKGVEIVATLDNRTTEICMSEDGNVYPVGSGPRPPFHWNCRTTTVPVLKSFKELGLKDPGKLPAGTRASMTGQVPARQTYQGWLKRQPKRIQAEALGKEKAKLFRSGRITVKDFVDDKRRTLTLAEIKLREELDDFGVMAARLSPEETSRLTKKLLRELELAGPAEGKKIRAKLRRLGHKGGLKGKVRPPPPGPPALPPTKLPEPPTKQYKTTREWSDKIGDVEAEALVRWAADEDMAAKIVKFQSTGVGGTPAVKKMIQDLERGLRRAPYNPDTVYRGLTNVSQEVLGQFQVGQTYTLPSFASATSSRKMAVGFSQRLKQKRLHSSVVLEMKHRTGVNITRFSEFTGEKETLFQRGRRFTVTKVETSTVKGNRFVHVTLEEVLPGVKPPVPAPPPAAPVPSIIKGATPATQASVDKMAQIMTAPPKRVSMPRGARTIKRYGEEKFSAAVDAINEELVRMKAEMPWIAKQLDGRRSTVRNILLSPDATVQTKQGLFAGLWSPWKRQISIALQGRSIPEAKLVIGTGRNWFVHTGKSFRSTFRHEFGHALQDRVFKLKRGRQWKALFDQKGTTWWKNNVSGYSATNYREAFAESFAAYTHPHYGAQFRLPKEVEKFMDDILRKPGRRRKAAQLAAAGTRDLGQFDVFAAALSPTERKSLVSDLLVQLRDAGKSQAKSIRAKLRRLGHRGGAGGAKAVVPLRARAPTTRLPLNLQSFSSERSAHQWGRQLSRSELFAKSQRQSLQYYQDTGYIEINEGLRGLGRLPPRVQGHVHQIDLGMRTLKEAVTTFRTLDRRGIFKNPAALVGQTIHDKGFISTSLLKEGVILGGRRLQTLKIHVPAGIRATYVDGALGQSAAEVELLLDRGLRLQFVSFKDGILEAVVVR